MSFYINTNLQDCSREISVLFKKCILSYPHHWTDLVFLCIGTDRVTGDCLGPYVGHRLSSFCFPGIYVYGTLVQPVHALNLCDTRKEILSRHPDSLIIAVDASLGQKKHLGYVTIANGALYPGAAVHKKTAACRPYSYYRNRQHSRHVGTANAPDHPSVNCYFHCRTNLQRDFADDPSI